MAASAFAKAGKAMRSPAKAACPWAALQHGSPDRRAAGLRCAPSRWRHGVRRQSLLGQLDRRLQKAVDAELAVILRQPAPGLDRARHGDGMDAVGTDAADAVIQKPLGARRQWRAACAVIGDDLVTALGRYQHEAIAADAGHRRLDHRQCRGCCDRRIDGIAAGAQDVDRDQRRQRMRGGCGATLSEDSGSTRLVIVTL